MQSRPTVFSKMLKNRESKMVDQPSNDGFVYSADADGGRGRGLCVFGGLCDDWYTNGHFCCFDCLLTVFDDWYTVGTNNSNNQQQQQPKTVKNSQTAKMTIGVPIATESAEYTKP